MELTLNQAVMNVQMSGIRRFTALARSTPGGLGKEVAPLSR